MNKRRHENQYSQSSFTGLYFMIGISLLGFVIKTAYDPNILHRPLIGQVEAKEVVQTIVVPLNTYNAPQYIVDLIVKYFGDEAQNALKIVGTCENKGWNIQATNHNSNGSLDSGIFQINSVHGYSQEYLFNPENNIRAAKKIFNGRGWKSWSCSHKIGVTPFYER